MIGLLSWYIVIFIAGWVSFPLVYHLFPALPDRGYSFSKAFAWLMWGYLFWLLASFGLIQNTAFSILICLLLVAIIGVLVMRTVGLPIGKSFSQMIAWVRSQSRLILTIEVLFLLAFAGWAFIRSTNPEALGTEKPMELAFINAILRSETFPPHDPWLSGYSISYYHFGYILVSMLAKITAVPGGIAFNLGISLVFALSAVGAYGLLYNLLLSKRVGGFTRLPMEQTREEKEPDQSANGALPLDATHPANHEPSWRQAWIFSFLGPIFLLLASNLEGLLHSLHNRGVFWKQSADGELVSSFWRWLDIQDLNVPPISPPQWVPDSFWWWWRASRVIQDYDLLGRSREIIDEFPFFSFLLADLHPHVIAIPFSLLAIALALHQYLKPALEKPLRIGPISLSFTLPEFLITIMILGSLGFLNTWDFPIYVAMFAAVYATTCIMRDPPSQSAVWSSWLKEFILSGFFLGLGGGLLFIPFYLGFSSQAGGLVVSLVYFTRGVHLWVMFALLLVGMGAYLLALFWQGQRKGEQAPPLLVGLSTGLILAIGLFALSLLFGGIVMLSQELRSFYLSSMAAGDLADLFSQAVLRRLTQPGAWLTLSLFFGFAFTLLVRAIRRNRNETPLVPSIHGFILVLILAGCLLVLFPEFFFLRDQFGWRMNTIFKFYFQAWIIWGAAASFGAAFSFIYLRHLKGMVVNTILLLVILASLVYPALSLPNKTNLFNPAASGLDSAAYLDTHNPDEAAAVKYLQDAPFGILAEAVSPTGGSYTQYARFATLTGLPGVLGWIGHESQWRGGYDEMGSRQADLARLYCTDSFAELISVIEQYNIRYVILGSLERSTYTPGSLSCPGGLNEPFLQELLNPIFTSGDITVFTVPGR